MASQAVLVALSGSNRLAITTHFANALACKTIPGGTWDPRERRWTYPATAVTAKSITDTFPRAVWSEPAKVWQAQGEALRERPSYPDPATLPPIPMTTLAPRSYQLQAYHFFKEMPGAMIALDMGCGKTKVALDLVINRDCHTILTICPHSVIPVWPDEVEKHTPARVLVVPLDEGSVRKRITDMRRLMDLARARKERVMIVLNYEIVWRPGMDAELLRIPWDAVILDEVHRIKAPGGTISRFLSRLADRVPIRIGLTGTPLPHSPMDAYAQYRFLDKRVFGTSYADFKARYAIMGGFGGHTVVGYRDRDTFERSLHSIMFRVKSDDVQDLPEVTDTTRLFTLTPATRKVYDAVASEFAVALADGHLSAPHVLTRLIRLQQIAGGYAKLDRDVATGEEGALIQVGYEKQDLLADVLGDIDEQEPVVVICRFHADLDTVHHVAAALGRGSLEISGRRPKQLKEWQRGDAPILALQISSGGVGIDLTRARIAIVYSLSVVLSDYLQVRKRIHRPGQTRNCTYIHLVAKNTVEQKIYRSLAAREEVCESFLQLDRTPAATKG